MMDHLMRRLAAEAAGTGFLVAAVIGSGIMAETLTDDAALQLLCNALATAAALVVIITLLAPISGAHLNPLVSGVFAARGSISWRDAGFFVLAQVAGGVLGTMASHLMFGLPLIEFSGHVRSGGGQWIAEIVASFGLLATILIGTTQRNAALPALVGLYIGAAYWFTASTSFANPAVTIARMLTDSFAGIHPLDVPAFMAAQVAGAVLAAFCAGWLMRSRT
jgi:glycerol uptake facilitator-like aquaporin